MSTTHSPIIIYHATYPVRPADMQNKLHDVHPDIMEAQIDWLAKYFDIVPVDDWFAAADRAGLACVTFDDAYECTFSDALPRLIERNIPSTVFLNGSTFQGKIFWRDMVRLLINSGQVKAFLDNLQTVAPTLLPQSGNVFYRATKSPAVSSKKVATAITDFLQRTGLADELIQHCASTVQELTDHPLVTYGNHTLHHYVLSSITEEEQQKEIVDNQALLDTFPIRRSRVFAIPFGGQETVTSATGTFVEQSGACGALYCHNRLNPIEERMWLGPVPAADRLLAPASLTALQKQFTQDA